MFVPIKLSSSQGLWPSELKKSSRFQMFLDLEIKDKKL